MKSLFDVPAPAKINLFLHVLGQRDDGYHLLQSVFMLIDWADTLHFDIRMDGQLSREDLGPALPADDLSLRAARALQRASGTRLGAHIAVDKQVPWGAGLGGGSSDAASTLLALNRLWGLNWPRSALLDLAVRLGADVPFFVSGRNAWVEGIGERITPIELAPTRLAVLKPPLAIPTSAIFGSPDLPRDSAKHIMAVFLADAKLGSATLFGRNDLQACALSYSEQQHRQVDPDAHETRQTRDSLGEALCLMAQHFGNSRMSGSGSAVFSVLTGPADGNKERAARDEADTLELRRLLATVPGDWVGRISHSLGIHPLQGWATD